MLKPSPFSIPIAIGREAYKEFLEASLKQKPPRNFSRVFVLSY
jgi:hypothetical protein